MPPDLDAVRAGAVTLYRCGDDFDQTKPRECSCDADPEQGPHRNDGDEIAPWPYMALPAPQFTALLDALAAARLMLLVQDFMDCRVPTGKFWECVKAAGYSDDVAPGPREWASEKFRAALSAIGGAA